MTITPVKAFNDNYIWIIGEGSRAVCIDPGDPAPAAEYLSRSGQVLEQIWITHHHHDHCGGIDALRRAYPEAAVYGNADIEAATRAADNGLQIRFGDALATVWATPGHTAHHLSYLLENSDGLHVFCGDTLFSAGCGRVFTGTIEALYESFQRYNSLPEHTLFYPAHEYTAANLRFAAHIEPDNADICAALQAAEQASAPTLPVNLAHERAVNPFLRAGLPQVKARVEALIGQPCDSGLAVFAALRELKNRF
ncbi:hydroxyacylglutathione hydrolase [Bergeriella denitrificans]|uniref:Hydroxyacylglutathione hydrolase n=1 Tax=Bergeriella denitrificans TaxID=494 RepID=A0A378UHC7_BERDE|nr:hydroxyacylglutathione hydrolase [Bergeriella denitrificans]STZ76163.1 hydroxyacylglutathione hydrolase [Bergeriella denitrificans]